MLAFHYFILGMKGRIENCQTADLRMKKITHKSSKAYVSVRLNERRGFLPNDRKIK